VANGFAIIYHIIFNAAVSDSVAPFAPVSQKTTMGRLHGIGALRQLSNMIHATLIRA
jgi:hypothetical protein